MNQLAEGSLDQPTKSKLWETLGMIKRDTENNNKIMFHNYVEFLSILLQKGRGGKSTEKETKMIKGVD